MNHIRKFILMLIVVLGFVGCSSSPKTMDESTQINDLLISFTVNSQASRWTEALELITYDEQIKMIDGEGEIKPEFQSAMRRMKLTAFQKQLFSIDGDGRLVGMFEVLLEANRRFQISDEQRKLSLTDVEKKAPVLTSAPEEEEDVQEVEAPEPSPEAIREGRASQNEEDAYDAIFEDQNGGVKKPAVKPLVDMESQPEPAPKLVPQVAPAKVQAPVEDDDMPEMPDPAEDKEEESDEMEEPSDDDAGEVSQED